MADPCGARLAVVPFENYGAEVRHMCVLPADEPHEWHADRFSDFRWKVTTAASTTPCDCPPESRPDYFCPVHESAYLDGRS